MAKKAQAQGAGLFHGAVPKMPEGFYSGDKVNRYLRAFAEQHLKERPYDPQADKYDVAAFTTPIETTKTSAVFSMHAYHLGKKPHDAIATYIAHYTQPGDLVLDPFCGSGSTAVAALGRNRKAIAIDLSPAATFITRFYVTPVAPTELQARFDNMAARVADEIAFLYQTRCHHCNGPATVHYVIYSNEYVCPRCLAPVTLFAASQYDPPQCPECMKRGKVEEPINSSLQIKGLRPVGVNFSCHGRCRPSRMLRSINGTPSERHAFEALDIRQIHEIESKKIPHPYPQQFMMNVVDPKAPWGDEWRPSRNFRKISELFTYRNLWALAALMEAADGDDDLRAVITSGMLAVSRKAQHLDGGGGYIPGNWALPPMSKQRNVLDSLRKVFNKTCAGKQVLSELLTGHQVCISTQSATDLSAIPSSSVDYVFTDPPYGGSVQYAELNFLWEVWLGFDTSWHSQEIIVNETRSKTETDWANMMRQAMAECYRVLKPGRWLSLCYHDTSEGTWALVQDIMAEVGFVVGEGERALYIDTGGNTYNQRVADKVNKRDLVINFRKPKPGDWQVAQLLIPADADTKTFRELARQIIREYLLAHPGATKDHIYDELVSRMVRAGTMEAHNFDEILSEVAEEVQEPRMKDLFRKEDPNLLGTHAVSRWYLKDRELEVTDAAESAKEDAAAEKIGAFIQKTLDKKPDQEGVHYSDLFEQYVYSVQDKPRRPLVEWLLDYFYKTDEGTFRLPVSEEEQKLKAEGRKAGTNRKVKRYVALLEQGLAIPEKIRPNDATLAEWIRHSKRSGLYEQGKLLYEKGGLNLERLPEETMVDVEEDYQVCVRMLGRNGGEDKKPKRGRRKKLEAEE